MAASSPSLWLWIKYLKHTGSPEGIQSIQWIAIYWFKYLPTKLIQVITRYKEHSIPAKSAESEY